MSTKKPSSSAQGSTKKPADPAGSSRARKKRKSAGFIESTEYQPSWLETGPLTPDMLPPPAQIGGLPAVDEYDSLQASLQRFYQQDDHREEEGAEEPADSANEPEAPVDLAPAVEEQSLPPIVDESESPLIDVGEELSASLAVNAGSPSPLIDEEDKPTAPLVRAEPPIFLDNEEEPPVSAVVEEQTPPALHTEEAPVSIVEADELGAPPTAEVVAEAPLEPEPSTGAVEAQESLMIDTPVDVIDEAAVKTPAEVEADAWVQPLLEVAATTQAVTATSLEPPSAFYGVEAEMADTFIEDELDEAVAAVSPMAQPAVRPAVEPAPKPRRAKAPKVKRRRDRVSAVLFISSLMLLGAAALIYFVNPFTRLALGSASLARPVESPELASPRTGSGNWCVQGNFLDDSAPPRLIDSGSSGDILAEDRVYSLDYNVSEPGTYDWQVVDCDNPTLAYPQVPAWITTTQPNQPVTFIFDSNESADPLFFPIPYVVSAVDAAGEYQVIGSFQDWNPDDASGDLKRVNDSLFQQVRRIARSGNYEAYVISGGENQAIDAYGRTTAPIPFSFQTDRNGDYVVFLVDTDRGRASVMYDMPPLLTRLAFGNGYQLLSLALTVLAGLLLLALLLRFLILHTGRFGMERGCPNCGQQELMRIARRPTDRFLHVLAIPAYRYRCRNCTWEGTRLSEEGATVSSGVSLTQFDSN